MKQIWPLLVPVAQDVCVHQGDTLDNAFFDGVPTRVERVHVEDDHQIVRLNFSNGGIVEIHTGPKSVVWIEPEIQ